MKLIRYENPQTPAVPAYHRFFDLDASPFERFNSIFDDFFAGGAGVHQPAADLYEDEQSYYARFQLPGLKKDEVDIELENSVLTVRSQQEKKAENTASKLSFQRSVSVPDGVALDKVSARLEDGLLTVTMPKAESRKPRQIKIK